METINFIIVEIDQEYNNRVKVGDVEIITNSTIESVDNINRIARVVSVPKGIILQEGDEVIVHHNMFRKKYGIRGNEMNSDYHIKDKLYFIPPNEIFMFRRDDTWEALSPFVFAKPIKYKDKTTESGLIILDKGTESHEGFVQKRAIIKYPNRELLELGVKSGDVIAFRDYSEYKFNIEGDLFYKMTTEDVLAIVKGEEYEETESSH